MFCKKFGKPMEEDRSKKGNLKRWRLGVTIVVLGCVLLFAGCGVTETEGEISDTQSESTDSDSEDAVEAYNYIAENDEPAFEISDKSIEFIEAHPEFFPGKEKIKGAISDFVDEDVTYAHLAKNISKYNDTLINVYGQVIEIVESEDGSVTYVHVVDYDGNSYTLYYLGSLDDVFEDSWIDVYALPFEMITFENMDATYTEAVVGAACYVEVYDLEDEY